MDIRTSHRPEPDAILQTIADYCLAELPFSKASVQTATLCLVDSLACALEALHYPACTTLLGPLVPGCEIKNGCHIPGTNYVLDPVQGAFTLGTMIRWLDFNDTWLAAEWGHPSDNFGGILAVADFLSRQGVRTFPVIDVLIAAIKAYEIQGVLALENSFNRVGLDHVLLVRIASTAVVTQMLGGNREQIISALSHAWMDGGALRAYRHAPNTGPRKSWAAGDATSRAVRLALLAMKNELGYPSVLTAPRWGFQEVLFEGKEIRLTQPLSSYVMENILFKISFPAEFHAQTAVEAAITLHPFVKDRLHEITQIDVSTQEPACRIIDKTGPLHNPADRDHCLQYMIAVGLLQGNLTAADYEDTAAANPAIDALRNKMKIQEDPAYTKAYYAKDQRAIPNAIKIHFADGTATEKVEVYYPIGHSKRREEGTPFLWKKFQRALAGTYNEAKTNRMMQQFQSQDALLETPITQLIDWF